MRPSSTIHDVMLNIIWFATGPVLRSDNRKFQELSFQDPLFANVKVCRFKFTFALPLYIDSVNNR